MARSAVPAVLLALAAVLLHVPHTAAWTGTTIALSGAVPANRAPVMVLAPSSGAVKNASLPLLLLLQPRCKGMLSTDSVFHFTNLVDTFNFALVVPEAGTAPGQCGSCPGGALANLNCRAWNATPACCASTGAHAGAAAVSVDDAAYLSSVIAAVTAKFPIDEQRIYVAGEDAGGFMAYHMACAFPDRIAAVMSLNGAMYKDAAQCAAFSGTTPVSVLEVHGMKDTEVPYAGGLFQGQPVPGALASASAWAEHNGCAAPVAGTSLELLRHGPLSSGPDTNVLNFPGCSGGAGVSLWSVAGLQHDVTDTTFSAQFARDVLSFFQLHPKGGLAAPTPAPGSMGVNALAGPTPRVAAPAPRRSPVSKTPAPPPPHPPTLLSRIRTSLEGHNAATAAHAPAPAHGRARAPAPSPAAMDKVEVNALSGPPAQGAPLVQAAPAPAPAVAMVQPPPAVQQAPPVPAVAPVGLPPNGMLTSAEVMAILSNPAALNSLIGGNLAANTALPANIKTVLANPAVQAVLTAAVSSPNPGQFIMNALSAAGLDLNTLLGMQSAMASAPAPAPAAAPIGTAASHKSGAVSAAGTAALGLVAALFAACVM